MNRELVRFPRPSSPWSSRLPRPSCHTPTGYFKPRDWDLVRPPCSAGSSPKTSRSHAGLPTSAGRSSLSFLLLLSLLERLSSLLLLLLLPLMPPKLALPGETDDVGGLPSAPPRPRLRVLPLAPSALRVAPGGTPSSCCRGQACCPSLTSSLRLGLMPPTRSPAPRSRLPLFGIRGQLLQGRERGRGYVLWCASTWR